MSDNCILAASSIDPAQQLREFSEGLSGNGAAASFTGIARPTAKDGTAISEMFLDHHGALTLASIQAIAAEAMQRFSVDAVCIHHRIGHVAPTEPIVFVAAGSDHRRAALDAVDFMMDCLKTDAVFWKREDSAEGTNWIEPTAADYAARSGWCE